jgi:hypothetical protein
MKALALYAGPRALAHIQHFGLQPADVRTIPAAAGGPKGLILGPLDRFVFGQWLAASAHPVDLIGGSIGAWRLATACLHDPVAALSRLEHDYIHQHYPVAPGQSRPPPEVVSELFGRNLRLFYQGRVGQVLGHPRYRLHVLASRGRGLLGHEGPWRTPLGYAGAFASNLLARHALGWWLQRVVFSSAGPLPFDPADYPTRQVALTEANFFDAMQASCSIPLVLRAVHDVAGAPPGAYWDGGVTDYHLHLRYHARAQASFGSAPDKLAVSAFFTGATGQNDAKNAGLVLYPHFQRTVVPGWLDKHLRWRHGATAALDGALVLAPSPQWVATLPGGKLPDRSDFTRFGTDLASRVRAWSTAVSAAEQLADEFADWLQAPDPRALAPL